MEIAKKGSNNSHLQVSAEIWVLHCSKSISSVSFLYLSLSPSHSRNSSKLTYHLYGPLSRCTDLLSFLERGILSIWHFCRLSQPVGGGQSTIKRMMGRELLRDHFLPLLPPIIPFLGRDLALGPLCNILHSTADSAQGLIQNDFHAVIILLPQRWVLHPKVCRRHREIRRLRTKLPQLYLYTNERVVPFLRVGTRRARSKRKQFSLVRHRVQHIHAHKAEKPTMNSRNSSNPSFQKSNKYHGQ